MEEELLYQLLKIKRAADAAIAQLAGDPVAAGPDGACPHPPARRRPAGVMGAPDQFLCLACSQLVTPEAADGTARDRSE